MNLPKRRLWSVTLLFLLLCQIFGQAVIAQEHGEPAQASGGSPSTPAPLNLDLTSTAATVTYAQATAVNIQVGGATQAVQQGQMVTPAQAVAAYQVLRTGAQNILVGADGSAIGGSMTIGSRLAGMLNSLVIPQGVTVINKAAELNLAGNLTNSGALYALAGNPATSTASIAAANILNGQGALISSIYNGTLPGLNNVLANLNLNLSAINNIINSGIISSAGNLNLTAGGSIVNALPQGVLGANPIMQAMNSISFNASNIVNSGLIAAQTGNINFLTSNQLAQNLNINNSAGILQALNGSINVRDALYNASGNLNITGGNLITKELNLYSGQGSVNLNVQQIEGLLNITANESHVTAATSNLTIGTVKLDGDPTFINAIGAITLDGLVTAGESLAILANGDITATGAANIQLHSAGTPFNLLMIAGAAITPNGNTDSPALPSAGTPTGSDVTVDFNSGAGGNINLTGSTFVGPIINTTGTPATDGSGGSVVLAARANGATGGRVLLPSGISTSGDGAGDSGSVTIIAGAASGQAISTGAISTELGSGFGGNIVAITAQPTGSAGNIITVQTDGTIAGGESVISSGTLNAADITIGQISSAPEGNIFLVAGGNLAFGAIAGGSVTLASGNNLILNNDVLAPGKPINIISGQSIIAGGLSTLIDSSGNDNGGAIMLVSGANFTASSSLLTITGASATGGNINLNVSVNANVVEIDAQGLAGNASGADVTLVAYAGTGGGAINLMPNGSMCTCGTGSGNDGNLMVIAGATNTLSLPGPATIALPNIDTAMGSGTGGTISIATATPIFSSGGTLTIDTTGAITSGNNYIPGTVQASGTVLMPAPVDSKGSLTVIAGNQLTIDSSPITVDGDVNISTAKLAFLAATGNPSIATSGANNIVIDSNIGSTVSNFVISGPSADFATISTVGGSLTINASPGAQLQFLSPDGTASTLNFNGSPISINTFGNSSITVGVNLTLSSDNQVSFNADTNGILAVNGTVVANSLISILSNGNLTFTGTGILDPGSGGIIGTSGGGNGGILYLANGLNWTIPNGELDIAASQIVGPSNGVATISVTDIAGCICIASNSFGTLAFTSNDGVSATTINLDAPFVGVTVGGPGETLTIGSGVTLSSNGPWQMEVDADATFILNGILRSTSVIPGSITVAAFASDLRISGSGTLDPGIGNAAALGSINDLVILDGTNINTINGDLNLFGNAVRVSNGGSATFINNAGQILLGDGCGCSGLTISAVTPGQSATLNLNGPVVLAANNGFTVNSGATLASTGTIYFTMIGGSAFSNDGTIRAGGIAIDGAAISNTGNLVSTDIIPGAGVGIYISDFSANTGLIFSGSGSYTSTTGRLTFESLSNTIEFASSTTLNAMSNITANLGLIIDNGVVLTVNNNQSADARLAINGGATDVQIGSTGLGTYNAAGGIQISTTGNNVIFGSGTHLLNGPATLSATTAPSTVTIAGGTTVNYTSSFQASGGTQTLVVTGTLAPLPPNTSLPVLSSAPAPDLNGAALTIQANIVANNGGTINVQGLPAPSPGLGTLSTVRSNGPNQFPGLMLFGSSQNSNTLNEQIGTRIATDYTSITPPGENEGSGNNPLTGQVAVNDNSLIDAVVVSNTEFSQATVSALETAGLNNGGNSQGNFFNLDRGCGIFAPTDTNIIVRTHEGDVHIAKDSIVQIYETGADVCILNLNDKRNGAVKVVSGNKAHSLLPGQELVLTRQKDASFEQINPLPAIATRKPSKFDLGNGVIAYLCDFSIPSALTNVVPLKKIIASNDPKDRRMANSLLKNAVMLTDFTASIGPYKKSSP